MEQGDIEKKKPQKPAEDHSNVRDYIEQQLEAGKGYGEVFVPLTHGLGLDSPAESPSAKEPETFMPIPDKRLDFLPSKKQMDEASKPAPRTTAEEVLREPSTEPKTEQTAQQPVEPAVAHMPPPLPAKKPVTWFRRAMAGLLDQAFVITLWAFSLVITLKVVTGSFVGFGAGQPVLLNDRDFLQFALLEYFAIWGCYLILCLGLLNMTFGMWIWGIRVDYSGAGSVGLRKVARALFSFVFYAPIAPILLLTIVGKKGRNLLDLISGTRLSRAH